MQHILFQIRQNALGAWLGVVRHILLASQYSCFLARNHVNEHSMHGRAAADQAVVLAVYRPFLWPAIGYPAHICFNGTGVSEPRSDRHMRRHGCYIKRQEIPNGTRTIDLKRHRMQSSCLGLASLFLASPAKHQTTAAAILRLAKHYARLTREATFPAGPQPAIPGSVDRLLSSAAPRLKEYF